MQPCSLQVTVRGGVSRKTLGTSSLMVMEWIKLILMSVSFDLYGLLASRWPGCGKFYILVLIGLENFVS